MLFFKKKTVTEEKPAEGTEPAAEETKEAPVLSAAPEPAPERAEAAAAGASFAAEKDRSQLAEILGVTDAELKSEFILTKIRKLTAKIEYVFLKPDATERELSSVAEEMKKYGFGKLCVLPSQVGFVKKRLPENVTVTTVVGYPFGPDSFSSALAAVRDLVKAGAGEIGYVPDVFRLKNGDLYDFRRRLIKLCGASKKRLRIVLEPARLDQKVLKKLASAIDRAPLKGVSLSSGYFPAEASSQLAAYKNDAKGNFSVTVYTERGTAEELTRLFAAGADMIATDKAAAIALELAAVNSATFD